jgi:hypothetical protein
LNSIASANEALLVDSSSCGCGRRKLGKGAALEFVHHDPLANQGSQP